MPEYFNEVRMPPAVNDCSYRTLPTTSTLLLDLFAPRYPPTPSPMPPSPLEVHAPIAGAVASTAVQ